MSALSDTLPRPMRVLILVAGSLLAAAVLPAKAGAQPLVTGVAGIDAYEPPALQQVRATGAKLVHVPIHWRVVAPRSPPLSWDPSDPGDEHYDWSRYDAAIMHAAIEGLTPVAMITSAPRWAQRCESPSTLPSGVCEPDPSAVAAFSVAAAARYGGDFAGLPRVRFWQGLNEPNLSLFFAPQWRDRKPVSPVLYRRLINAFYAGVKSVHRSNLVLAAGLGPIAVPGSTIGPMRFARRLLCMRGRRGPQPKPGDCGGGVHFDILDIHPYTTGAPWHQGKVDDVQLGDLAKLTELVSAADRAGRIRGRFRRTPVWITEFSWDSKPPDPGGVPMPILKRWTAEALFQAWRSGISRFFWYGLRDDPPNPKLPFSESYQFGLYFRGATAAQNRPKPHMYAFRFPFVAYSRKDGFFFWGRTPNSKRGKVLIQIRKGGRWRNAVVARADKFGIFKGIAKGDYGRRKRGFVRARYHGEGAVPFSLKPVRGFYQPPFGRPVPE